MIKAIIFDLGGVLFTNGTKKFVNSISKRHGIEREKVEEIMNGDLGTLYREAKITRDEFWERALNELNINESVDKLEQEWIDGYELIEGTKTLIQELSKKYKIYFLSDNVKERVSKINERYNFMDWFEDGVFSHEVGVRKPNPEIYKITLSKINTKPEEAVFIDDKPEMLAPAQETGMLTFLFESPEKLQEDLIKNNLLEKR